MNSAFTDNHAGTKAVRIARTVLRGALAAALVLGAGTVSAQQYNDRSYGGDRQYGDRQYGDRGAEQAQHQGRERFSLPQQDRGQRDAEMRAYEDQRRAQQQDQAYPQRDDPRRPSSRLTPDERRDLRRQINEAGMDLYPRRR